MMRFIPKAFTQLIRRFDGPKCNHILPLSQRTKRVLNDPIKTHENERLNRMYQGLFELSGMCDAPITDASSSIDELLYGENGIWRGEPD